MSVPIEFSSNSRHDLPRGRHLVTPAWIAGLVAGAITASAGGWLLFEVGFGMQSQFETAHIDGAAYLDTSELEGGPWWNKVADAQLLACLLRHGIRHDVTVVLYGRNNLAAARAAHLLLYAGVADVRLLDGGFALWRAAGWPTVAGAPRGSAAVASFGAAFPGRPEFLCDMGQARALLARQDGVLVSTRSWSEFIGRTSGYSYIPVRGDIPGARWGRAGADGDVNSMSEFHDDAGCMLPPAAIAAMWRAGGVHAGQRAVFYCGTGWRASLAFYYAWLMGWDNIAVFDGGWCEWSADPQAPVLCRVDAGAIVSGDAVLPA